MSLKGMRAAILDKDKSLRMRDNLYIERPKKGEVLVRVLACGVCHTDLHVVEGKVYLPTPAILGHEIYGVVEDIGEGVSTVSPGDHVVSSFMWPCGRCRPCISGYENLCEASIRARAAGVMLDGTSRVRLAMGGQSIPVYVRNGGFAEYAVIPTENAISPVPEKIRSPEVAILGCAFLTAYGAVFNSAHIKAGDRVAVFGVGGVGMAIVKMASIAGADVIAIDVVEEKLNRARQVGARYTINSGKENPVEAVRSIAGGEGVDIAIEAVGIPHTVQQAIDSVRIGGKVIQVGLGSRAEVDLNRLVIRGISIVGSYGARPRIDLPRILGFIENKLIDLREFITGIYGLHDIEKALNDVKRGLAIRSIVIP
jgi:succinate semialdehyde reductase (NADPH)